MFDGKCGLKLQSRSGSKETNGSSLSQGTWQAPGKKDRVIYREKDVSGKTIKRTVQVRYLTMSLWEA